MWRKNPKYRYGWLNCVIGLRNSNFYLNYNSRHSGFSLSELLVALAIAGAASVSAAPALNSFVVGSRQSTQVDTLFADLSYARTESIRRGVPTIVCKSRDGQSCDRAAKWHDGWLVFADDNDNQALENDEDLLRAQGKSPNGIRIKFGSFRSRGRYMQYLPIGLTTTNGTFTICRGSDGKSAKAIITSRSGRSRVSSKTSGNKVLNCS